MDSMYIVHNSMYIAYKVCSEHVNVQIGFPNEWAYYWLKEVNHATAIDLTRFFGGTFKRLYKTRDDFFVNRHDFNSSNINEVFLDIYTALH